jgi:AcrR family transcriptional regulator
VRALVERGYTGTTTVTIQELADVSRGRLLHHFPSRDALLVAAAEHPAVERINEMERWFSEAPIASGGDRIDRASEPRMGDRGRWCPQSPQRLAVDHPSSRIRG